MNLISQQLIQTFLVIVIVICIPWILVPKPFLLWRRGYTKVNIIVCFLVSACDVENYAFLIELRLVIVCSCENQYSPE